VATIRLKVGVERCLQDGRVEERMQVAEFDGERVAEVNLFGTHRGKVTDTRGTRQALYRTADGRLVVHVEDWSNWQGEGSHCRLHEVHAVDLGPIGKFAELGQEAGMGRPLTLDEALGIGAEQGQTDEDILEQSRLYAEQYANFRRGAPLPASRVPSREEETAEMLERGRLYAEKYADVRGATFPRAPAEQEGEGE
jgi:hypothetical protein